jgi:hypothetical protein
MTPRSVEAVALRLEELGFPLVDIVYLQDEWRLSVNRPGVGVAVFRDRRLSTVLAEAVDYAEQVAELRAEYQARSRGR